MSTYDVAGSSIPDSFETDLAPLSYTQQQLWFAEQIDPDQSLYMEVLAVRIRGTIDPAIVERALREVLRRHEALRTVIPLVDGRPMQRVLPADTPLEFRRSSVADLPETEREDAVRRRVAEFVERPLDLTSQLLVRASFISLAPDDQVLAVTLHHFVCDGLSGGIIFDELGRLYGAYHAGQPSPLDEPKLQYADFIAWERELYQSGYLDDDIDYWRRQLAGVASTLELPAQRPRPDTKGVRGTRAQFPLADARLHAMITRFCQEHSASVYALTLAAWAATVCRYTGQHDLVFGTLAANRARSELESVVGQFTNTLPMRVDLTGDPKLLELIGRASRTSEEAIEHGLVSLGKIIELISPPRDPSRNALIQHLFLTSGQPASETTWGSASVAPFDVPRNRGRLDTIVEVEARGTDLVSWVEYDTQLLEHAEVEQLMHHFSNVVAEWIGNPGLRVSELTLLDRAEIDDYVQPRPPDDGQTTSLPPSGMPGLAIGRASTFDRLAALVSQHVAGAVAEHRTAARLHLHGDDAGAAVARVLASATQQSDVVLCTCAVPGDAESENACACRPLEATEVVRIAHSLADVLWSEPTSHVVLADDVPVEEQFLIQLAAVMRGIGTTVVAGAPTAHPAANAVVVTGTRLAELLDATPARLRIIVAGTPERGVVARLAAAGHLVVSLVGHPDVLGPYMTVRSVAGEAPSAELLPHVDAMVLDDFAHVPPVGVLGRLHLRGAPLRPGAGAGERSDDLVVNPYGRPGEQLLRTALTARRIATGGMQVHVDTSLDVADASAATTTADTPLHELLGDLWREVLGIDTVALDDDFFELGGHSMLSARMIERVRETLRVEVPLRLLFTYSRFGEFVEALQTSFPEIADVLVAVGGLSDEDIAQLLQSIPSDIPDELAGPPVKPHRFPLTSAQLQIWMMEYLRGAGITYTIPLEFRITGPLDVDALRRTIQRIIQRHDMLRVTVELTDDGEPVQVVHESVDIDTPFTDLTGATGTKAADDIRRQIGYFEFSVADGPLLATHIVRHAPRQHTLYIVFHHLVMDERSMGLFMSELSAIYAADVQGARGPADLTVQIGDYVAWERVQLSPDRRERLQSFWRSRVEGIPELVLPTDFPRPANLTFKGEFLYTHRERTLFEELAELAGAHRVTPFIVFTAATALLLHELSGQDQFLIGMPTDTRGMAGSNELIGCFINVLPVRVDCGGSPTFIEFMRRLRDEITAGYDNRALPLSAIVNAVGAPRTVDRLPLFQVVTELQVEGWMPISLPGCQVEFAFINHGTARYDLAFHAMAKPDAFDVCVEVNNTIFTFETAYRMLDQLTELIRRVIRDPNRRLADYFGSRPSGSAGV